MNTEEMTKQISGAKKEIADLVADLIDKRGFDMGCVLAAVGSVAGNLVGLYMPREEFASTIEAMKRPMMHDANRAADQADQIIH